MNTLASHVALRTMLVAALLWLGPTGAQAKSTQEVVITGPDPLPVEIVPSPDSQTGACALYDGSSAFQVHTNFGGLAFSYDTLIQAAESFVVTKVVVYMNGEQTDVGSIIASFNNAGATINPGISIDPPASGNLGIDFAPSHSFVSGRYATAIFEPDMIFGGSTVLRVRLMNTAGGENVKATQASVSIRGCLLNS